MKFYLRHTLLLIILMLHFRGLSQFAIAGTQGIFYTDINPDTVLSTSVITFSTSIESFDIDINNDGINDIKLKSYSSGGGISGVSVGVEAQCLQPYVEISVGGVDTTYPNPNCGPGIYYYRSILKIYNQLDTIQAQNFGQTASGFITYNNTICGYNGTNNQWVGLGDRYIGVSYFNSVTSTTYYGWIRVNVTSTSTCIVKDYSLFAPTSINIKEANENLYSIKVFPNPSNEGFNCILKENSEEVKFKLNDFNGKEIQVDFIKQEEGKYYLDTKNIVEGIYFLEIKSTKEIIRKKIVVQH